MPSAETAGSTCTAVSDALSNDVVQVLLGNGDRHVPAPGDQFAVGTSPNCSGGGRFRWRRPARSRRRNGRRVRRALGFAGTQAQSDESSVLLGNGDGTFQPAVQYAAGLSPVSIWWRVISTATAGSTWP